MTKREFLDELRARLSGLPERELEERIAFYGEMIDDRMEEGLGEEEAVGDVGNVDAVADAILSDVSLVSIVKDRVTPRRKLAGWEIALLIIGAPLWVPLLLSVFAVILSLYISLWAVIVAFWSVFASFGAVALAGIVLGIHALSVGVVAPGLALIGVSLIFAGLSIFTFFGCSAASRGAVVLAKKMGLLIKRAFMGKEKK